MLQEIGVAMKFKKTILSKLFRSQEDDFLDMELDEGDEEEFEWDWENIINEKKLFRMSDDVQRSKYLRSLVEQVRDASMELDKLSAEYNNVTATLKDMDEIDALPLQEKIVLQDAARKILYYEDQTKEYDMKKSAMTEDEFRVMERMEDQIPKAITDIREAEEYRSKVRSDMKTLDGEKHAYLYNQAELRREMNNLRGMVIICGFAAILCVIMLVILRFGFEMDTTVGNIITVLVASVAIFAMCIKYQDDSRELTRAQKDLNRVILLHNTVKIRYVNNANLLDYLCTKYNTAGSKDLEKLWKTYKEECALRESHEINEKELGFNQQELLKRLRKYQLNDVYAWLHNPRAILERNEMVELRHAHILQRQKLRARMDYNKRLAKDGKDELKEFVKQYPEYSSEALDMVNRYSEY